MSVPIENCCLLVTNCLVYLFLNSAKLFVLGRPGDVNATNQLRLTLHQNCRNQSFIRALSFRSHFCLNSSKLARNCFSDGAPAKCLVNCFYLALEENLDLFWIYYNRLVHVKIAFGDSDLGETCNKRIVDI